MARLARLSICSGECIIPDIEAIFSFDRKFLSGLELDLSPNGILSNAREACAVHG
jgi:hypothetical protein